MKNALFSLFEHSSLEIIGLGVSAFNRVMPTFFIPNYQIICIKNSRELEHITAKRRVISLERDFGERAEKMNTLSLIQHPRVVSYLKTLKKPVGIFVYKPSVKIAQLCQFYGWKLLGNQPEVRDPYEDKRIFRETLEKLGISPIEGETLLLKDFNQEIFSQMQRKYGQKLVLKLSEVVMGGGIGNTFVEKLTDLERFWEKVHLMRRDYQLRHLIIERKIDGLSPSITGCATHYGVLTSVVQTQITDIPEVINPETGGGMFIGHDWSLAPYSPEVRQQAEKIAKTFGKYLYQQGYRGIFGIDLLVEKKTEKVYPCECNPRYTGAFPVYSMIQWAREELPFDVFHLLEHLGIDYRIDFEAIQNQYRQPRQGAHLILYNKNDSAVVVGGELEAGVYGFEADKLLFIRPGFSYLDIRNQEEFVITDGVPYKGTLIRPKMRILKIIFPQGILNPNGKGVDKRTKLIVENVYGQLGLERVKSSSIDLPRSDNAINYD